MESECSSIQVNKPEIEKAIRSLLLAVGENPDREGLKETPARVAKMYQELLCGFTGEYKCNPTSFSQNHYDEIILLKDIPIYSLCEHHLLPFLGQAHVAYIPDKDRLLGISKLARIVEKYARRFQIQERMTTQIADEIEKSISPKGIAVIIKAEHFCMTMRGVKKPGSKTITSVMRGCFYKDDKARIEILKLMEF